MFDPSGSLKLTSSPVVKIPPNVDVTLTEVKSDIEKLAVEPHINESFSHKSTYNPITSLSTVAALLAYPSSTTIVVTWYTKNTGEINTRTAETDFALVLGLTQNYTKIVNFEFRMAAQGLTYAFNQETNVSTYTGVGYVYSKFDAMIGDVFLYQIDTGNLGLFKITNKVPLSIHRDTLHEVEFELILFPTISQLNELNSYVDRTAHFFKDTFFNGDVGLVYDETYQLLSFIHQKKEILLTYYMDLFYDDIYLKSFVRPDGIYDPYLVEFMHSFINFNQMEHYPKKLLSEYPNQNKNIFVYLLSFHKLIKSLIPNRYVVTVKEYSHRDTDINALINRQYVQITKETEGTLPYILDNLMVENTDAQIQLEIILHRYFTERVINPTTFTTLIDSFLTLSEENQFYYIPIYLYLLAVMEGLVLR